MCQWHADHCFVLIPILQQSSAIKRFLNCLNSHNSPYSMSVSLFWGKCDRKSRSTHVCNMGGWVHHPHVTLQTVGRIFLITRFDVEGIFIYLFISRIEPSTYVQYTVVEFKCLKNYLITNDKEIQYGLKIRHTLTLKKVYNQPIIPIILTKQPYSTIPSYHIKNVISVI